MKYYQDITLLPDAEANLGFLWQKVFQQVHLALVKIQTEDHKSNVAVSFPDYGGKGCPLGAKLRLFSKDCALLEKLAITQVLERLMDYVHCRSIQAVPEVIDKYVCFNRKQFRTNVLRLARRRVVKHKISLDDALKHYEGFMDQETTLPFINMQSLSSDRGEVALGHQFRLFIEKDEMNHAIEGEFNCYGLSKTATVPWF